MLLPAPGRVFVALVAVPAALMAVYLKIKDYFTLVSVLAILLIYSTNPLDAPNRVYGIALAAAVALGAW